MNSAVEIAGVQLAVHAEEPWLREAFEHAVLTQPVVHEAPPLRMELICSAGSAPGRAPDDEQFGVELWFRPDGPVVRCRNVVLEVAGPVARAHVPSPADVGALDALINVTLCWLLAQHDRYVVHAAAVGRGEEALLVLGHSGSGKSTTVFACLDAGWWALSDDLVALEAAGDDLWVHGIHQAIAAPTEIGGSLIDGSRHLDDLRRRGRVEREILTPGRRRVAGTVMVGHSPHPEGDVERLLGHQVMPLVMQSFAASADPRHTGGFLRLAGQLSRLPAWYLGHSNDPAGRREAAVTNLLRCLAEQSEALTSDEPSPR